MILLIRIIFTSSLVANNSSLKRSLFSHITLARISRSSPTFLSSRLQGVLHTVSGYMLYTATTFKLVFDSQPDDIYWCTADIGWITGHSYITYGPLANGATSVLVGAG